MKKICLSLCCLLFINTIHASYSQACAAGHATPYSTVVFFATNYSITNHNSQIMYNYSVQYPNGYIDNNIGNNYFYQYSTTYNCVLKQNFDETKPQVEILVTNSNTKEIYFSGKLDYLHQELDCRCTGHCDATEGDFIQCNIMSS